MPTATSAATFHAYELDKEFAIKSLAVKERHTEPLQRGEVRIKIHAVSLNFRDLMMVKGTYNPKLRFPFTPCSDGVGEVVDVGEGVSRFKIGDRVSGIFMPRWLGGKVTEVAARSALGGGGNGMLSQSVVLHEDGMVSVPEHLSYEEAATLPCAALTAWNALIESGKLRPGETVLTLGTGGVSIFAVQIALLNGASVIGTSSNAEKLERLKKLGVKHVINYKENPNWGKAVLELTGGRGVDHVVEVGGAGTLANSIQATAIGGQVSVIGALTGKDTEVDVRGILMKTMRVQGIFVGSREMFENMNAAIRLHQLKPIVDKVFAFDQAIEAFQYMESGSHFGKVVIKVS